MVPEIKTANDFERVQNEVTRLISSILELSGNERWNDERLLEELTKATFAHFKALADPANPLVTGLQLKKLQEGFTKEGMAFRHLSPEECPEIHAAIADHVAALNKAFGVDYSLPRVISVDGLNEKRNSYVGFSAFSDVILIDSVALQSLRDSGNHRAILGHELAHRYERWHSDFSFNYLKTTLAEIYGIPIDDALARQAEARADVIAARLTSPDEVVSSLEWVTRQPHELYAQFLKERMGTETTGQAPAAYRRAPAQRQAHIREDIDSLSDADLERYYWLAAAEQGSEHPSTLNRITLQQVLKENPALLTCRHMRFDGSANIISAQECGPETTPPTNLAEPRHSPDR